MTYRKFLKSVSTELQMDTGFRLQGTYSVNCLYLKKPFWYNPGASILLLM